MRKLMIAPSVGCCDLFHIEEQVKLINEKSDFLHMDIKDGVYVPSYGIGPDYLDYLNKHIKNLKPMDAHLMVKHPQQYLETFAKAGAAYITPHTDENGRYESTKEELKNKDKVGIMLSNCSCIEIVDNEYRIITSEVKAHNIKEAYALRGFYQDGKYYEEKLEESTEFKSLEKLLSKN